MAAVEVSCRRWESVAAVRGEGEMAVREGVGEVGTRGSRVWLSWRFACVYEGPPREETDRLGYGGLEEPTVLRMR
jgi:hypothetical protein